MTTTEIDLTALDWEIRDFGTSPVSIVVVGRPSEGSVAKVYVTEHRRRGRAPRWLKVARLLAHAPQLLKALRDLLGCVDDVAARSGWPDNKPRNAARELIAKLMEDITDGQA